MANRDYVRSYSHPPHGASHTAHRAKHGWNLIYNFVRNLLPSIRSTYSTKGDGAKEPGGTDTGAISAKQDDAWTQATFNATVLVLLVIAGCICWAVYCVLSPFLHPLLWAILIGSILHPLKRSGTDSISTWLSGLKEKRIPLSVGIVLSPLHLFDSLSSRLYEAVGTHWETMLVSVFSVFFLRMLYIFNLPYQIMTVVYFSLRSVSQMMSVYIGAIQLALLISFLFSLTMITRTQSTLIYITTVVLSVLNWFLAALTLLSYLLGSAVALPFVVCVSLTGVVVPLIVELQKDEGTAHPISDKQGLKAHGERDKSAREGDVEGSGLGVEEGSGGPSELAGKDEADFSTVDSLNGDASNLSEENIGPDNNGSKREVRFDTDGKEKGDEKKDVDEGNKKDSEEKAQDERTEKVSVFLNLSIFFFVMVFWRYPFLLYLLVPFALWALLKRVFNSQLRGNLNSQLQDSSNFQLHDNFCSKVQQYRRGLQSWIHSHIIHHILCMFARLQHNILMRLHPHENRFLCKVKNCLGDLQSWIRLHKTILFPTPLPALLKIYLMLDQKVLQAVKNSVSSLMSAIIVTSLLFGGMAITVFLALQIQVELTHYVTMMAAIWNKTLSSNPQLLEWVGTEGKVIQDAFGSFANQGYVYGREWLAGQVQSFIGNSLYNNSAVEKQVLNLYDQLYQSYVLKNNSMFDPSPAHHDQETGEDFLYELPAIIMDNLETVISVLKHGGSLLYDNLEAVTSLLWYVVSLLHDNLSLAFYLFYTFLQLLLSGGTALMNTVVFLTALFYLLCYSEEKYLPVKIVIKLLHNLTQADHGELEKYIDSFPKATSCVFLASLNRSLFCGLYMWLVHMTFELPVSILPAVLAAIVGALPLISPYWIALPAVLELWLVKGQMMSAITVLSLSLLPAFLMDSIIYGEIKGSHPYLTGLAVAGGIYFAGMEGAIIGPILLCYLIFVHNEYTKTQTTPTTD